MYRQRPYGTYFHPYPSTGATGQSVSASASVIGGDAVAVADLFGALPIGLSIPQLAARLTAQDSLLRKVREAAGSARDLALEARVVSATDQTRGELDRRRRLEPQVAVTYPVVEVDNLFGALPIGLSIPQIQTRAVAQGGLLGKVGALNNALAGSFNQTSDELRRRQSIEATPPVRPILKTGTATTPPAAGPGSEFPIGGAPAPTTSAAPNYLVPAIIVAAALLTGGYLLSRPRA